MTTKTFKNKLYKALKQDRKDFTSMAKQASYLKIKRTQLEAFVKGDYDAFSDGECITLSRKLGLKMNPRVKWQTAKTPTFNFIMEQLTVCQEQSVSAMLCDFAGIGKTYTAEYYASLNKNVIYVDCSQVPTKLHLISYIASSLKISRGHYMDMYNDIVYYLKNIKKPLIILDEAGDLDHNALATCKSLWNATEHYCGWYMMGADGLSTKINRNRDKRKVGYAEIFDRFGAKFQKITPEGKEAHEDFIKLQLALIARSND